MEASQENCAALESSLFDGIGKQRRDKPGADDAGKKNDGA
jgi:hypothetical protein